MSQHNNNWNNNNWNDNSRNNDLPPQIPIQHQWQPPVVNNDIGRNIFHSIIENNIIANSFNNSGSNSNNNNNPWN